MATRPKTPRKPKKPPATAAPTMSRGIMIGRHIIKKRKTPR